MKMDLFFLEERKLLDRIDVEKLERKLELIES